MAFISAGYDGTVDEVQFAGMLPKAGTSEYGVSGAGDFAVTAVAGQDRTVSIAPGTAWGHSVTDVMDANETLALTAPTSGSRWDMICLHRDWQPPGGATSVSVVEGGASATTIPARLNNPGVLDEQPLYLARVDAGSTTIGQLIDLRCWGRNGSIYAKDERVLQYLTAIGTEVSFGRQYYTRIVSDSNVAEWQRTDTKYAYYTRAESFTFRTSDANREAKESYVTFPQGLFSAAYSNRPNVQLTVTGKSGQGRFIAQADNVSTQGFTLRVYQSDVSEEFVENVNLAVDILATQ